MTYTKEQVLAIIGENDGKDTEFELMGVNYYRNRLREEQRQRLENMKPKKTREVIKYC